MTTATFVPFLHKVERGQYDGYRCSSCQTPFIYCRPLFSAVTTKAGGIFNETPRFCPCCGAKGDAQ